MKSIHSSVAVLVSVASLGLGPATALAETAGETQPLWLASRPESMTLYSSQYVQEISLDMCSWEERPITNVCNMQNPNNTSEPWAPGAGLGCSPASSPRPAGVAWFDFTATDSCPIDRYNGCRLQRWAWPDGRMVSGWGYNVLHCPMNAAEMGTGLYSKVMMSTVPGHVFLQVPGFFSHLQPQYVRGQVLVEAIAHRPFYPSGLPEQSMSFTLALQSRNTDGTWQDRATQQVWAKPSNTSTFGYTWYEVGAWVSPNTEVRVEMRAQVVPPLRVADENDIWRNYALNVDVIDARLILPECIPDMNNPGQCL